VHCVTLNQNMPGQFWNCPKYERPLQLCYSPRTVYEIKINTLEFLVIPALNRVNTPFQHSIAPIRCGERMSRVWTPTRHQLDTSLACITNTILQNHSNYVVIIYAFYIISQCNNIGIYYQMRICIETYGCFEPNWQVCIKVPK
jgi:hypothetical protein